MTTTTIRSGLAALLVLAGCDKARTPSPSGGSGGSEGGAGSGMLVQVRLGGSADDEPEDLRFAIDKVYDHQQATATAPFHAGGGTWTYVDAHLIDDPAATFGVGMPPLDDEPAFSGMILVPTTGDAGARFVRAFVRHFHVAAPPPIAGTLAPEQIANAVLGHAVSNGDNGFSGTGTWDATKWFFDDGEAEMFFNISVADRMGAWSEKAPDYDRDVAAAFAMVLRDGLPPPRTPANDPTLAATGPALVIGPKIGSQRAEVLVKAAARVLIVDDDRAHATLVSIDPKTGTATELYRTAKRLEGGACDPSGQHCVIRETTPSKSRDLSSWDDKATLLAIDGRSVAPLAVAALGDHPSVRGLSPDGRFVASGDKGLVVWDRTAKQLHTFDRPAELVDVSGWRTHGSHELAIVDYHTDVDRAHHYVAWDLETNRQAPTELETTAIAPDGSRRAEIKGDGTVIVTPLPSGAARSFVLDPRDRIGSDDACCTWIDSRYVWLSGKTAAVIDTNAMKVSFVGAAVADGTSRPMMDPFGTRQMIVRDDDGLFLARLVGP